MKYEIATKEAESERSAGIEVQTFLAQIMGVVSSQDKSRNEDGCAWWKMMSIAIDFGAAETEVLHTLVTEHRICATDTPESGACYASATGEPIPNLREQRLPMATAEGSLRAMTFQAAPVAKPLGSVDRICKAGHTVVFDADGSYIVNKTTGEVNWLREDNCNFMLDVSIPPQSQVEPEIGQRTQPPFGRQP